MKKKIIIFTGLLLLIVGAVWAMTEIRTVGNINQNKESSVDMTGTISEVPQDATIVSFNTSEGPIKVWLYDDTPKHKENFLKLVKEGYYDGVLFHRVIKDFMVQTGDPDSKTAQPGTRLGSGSPDYTIEAEILYPVHYHKYGALAAARTGDQFNPEKRSSGSQFYIVTGKKYGLEELSRFGAQSVMAQRQEKFRQLCLEHDDSITAMQKRSDRAGLEKLQQQLVAEVESLIPAPELPENIKHDYTTIGGTPHLDGAYTVFGEVIEGMDVVEKIQNSGTDRYDRPLEDIRVIKAEVQRGK